MTQYPTAKEIQDNAQLAASVDRLAEKVSALARAKGWHRDVIGKEGAELERAYIPLWIANMHGELSELWESYRRGELGEPCDKAETGLNQLEEEAADLFIRLADGCHLLGVDLGRAIMAKHSYNSGRSYRHGDKVA